ncbi:MAG TPA: hypothetical protein VJL89_11285, partial [Thermodesulfovibrionia bacterium]|nr:hypothetical protein [Thermodesulfovibrionia bacterium]
MGLVLVLLHFVLLQLSHRFTYGLSIDTKPVFWLVALLIVSGLVYVGACLKVTRCSADSCSQNRTLLLILAVGLILRVNMLFSTPMLEDDYYRYLWDGAVVSHGINPYIYSPKHIMNQQNNPLASLAFESGHVIERVNHPDLRTIYPPVAQAAFSLAYWLQPWSLIAWRIVLLLCDLISLGLLMFILKKLHLPLALILVFWWNPLYVKEVFNSGHMEGVLVPFLFGFILFVSYNRHFSALICLVLAAAVKLWPVVLLPVLLRPFLSDVKRLLVFIALFCLLMAGMFWPVYMAGFGTKSGFIAYGQFWQMNDSLFTLIFWASRFVFNLFDMDIHVRSQLVAKGVVLFILAVLTVFVSQRNYPGGEEFSKRCLIITAGLFLLSPTQFPWYSVWFLPFLAV